jgi:hypothetical protein
MRSRPLAAVLAAGVVFAGIASCSDVFSPEVPTVSISLIVEPRLALPSLTLRVAINGRRYEVRVDSAAQNTYVIVPVSSNGVLPVRMDLLNGAGDTLASSEFQQHFRADYNSWVSGWVAARPPFALCGGPGLPVATRLADTLKLYVDHGGMPKDAMC